MDIRDIEEKEEKLKRSIKRNCTFSIGRLQLHRKEDPEKKLVELELKELYDLYKEKYDVLRKQDADGQLIQDTLYNKRLVLDTIELCKNPDLEPAHRKFNSLK